MRIAIAVALVLALFPSRAAAQEPLAIGVKGGLNIASAAVSTQGFNVSPDSRPGVVVGAFMGADFHESFGMQVEGLYVQKGATLNQFGLDIDLRLDYIEIPILARANIRANEDTRLHFLAGPAFAFTVDKSFDIADLGFGFDTVEMRSWDAGIAVGGAVSFRRLMVDARYTFGLVNVNDTAEEFLEVKNRAFALTVGWRFR